MIRDLIGQDVELQPVAGAEDGPSSLRFAQVVRVDGAVLPLSCNGVSFYYKDGTLSAIESNVIPTEGLEVSGTPGALAPEEAKALVARQLGIEPDLIGDASQCVYLVGGDSSRARVAVKLDVQSGGKPPDIEVFVDSQTKQILTIR